MPHLVPNIKLFRADQLSTISRPKSLENLWFSDNSWEYRNEVIHSNTPMGKSSLTHQGGTITLVFSSKSKIILDQKHALLPFWLVITITLLTNRCSTEKQPTVAGNLNDVSLCTSNFKNFKLIVSFCTGTLIWWHVDCSARGIKDSI